VPEGGPGEARHLLAPAVVGHAHHGHIGDQGVRPAWRTGHRPVLTSRIRKILQAGVEREPRQRSRKETADHREQPDKDREYSLDGSLACQEKTGTPATCQQMLPAVCGSGRTVTAFHTRTWHVQFALQVSTS
jgi:hypothetical protein